jgi:hypothetical protein
VSFLVRTYKLEAGPTRVSWETYASAVTASWNALLARDPEETEVQAFLERHPGLLPGYRSLTIAAGYSCIPPAVITQPPLSGLIKKVPDFMWIAHSSDLILPTLIEIEKPGKRWFKKDGDPTADLTHARQQLATWRSWFRNLPTSNGSASTTSSRVSLAKTARSNRRSS